MRRVASIETALDVDVWGRVGSALCDPTRRAVLSRLMTAPAYPADLADELGVGRANLSNHLACLRGCGFVTATYEGRRVRYDLADPAIATVLRSLSALPLHRCPEDGRS
jgi:DNA-binding transcriptional ArsR family regulator